MSTRPRTLGVAEWAIERTAVDFRFGAWLTSWRALRDSGWEVTVLVSSDSRHAVGFGYLPLLAETR